jgi:predicted ATPase/transcriptional regulator with XRE-family HTH domain
MPTTLLESPAPSFGDILRRVRVAHGLTQEALAERSGLSVRGISDLERGVRRLPHRETILRLSAALQLPADQQQVLLAFAQREPRPRPVLWDVPWPFALAARSDTFVGRAAELSAILRALHEPGHRLLTLTGPPGVGKTRLAREAMQRLGALVPVEIVFVDLAPLSSPLLVLPAMVAAVGMRETAIDRLHDRLQTHLTAHPALLVLDNFEHLLPSTPPSGGGVPLLPPEPPSTGGRSLNAASVVDTLLKATPAVRFLVTSREPLRIDGEVVLTVPPLNPPQLRTDMGLRDVVDNDAVALFAMRARESDPSFHLTDENARAVAELCIRLDGLPLALELAAVRVQHLSPADIVERLVTRRPVLTAGGRDLPERQRTLADAIDWSYALLCEDERRLLRRLSVFCGGFTLSMATSFAASLGEHDVPATLASLVDKSLIVRQLDHVNDVRLTMLETIREYGLERLATSREETLPSGRGGLGGEETAVRQAHATAMLTFAEEAARDFHAGAGQRAAIARLEDEHDNLRQALGWALQQPDPTPLLRLSEALWRFWWIQGHLSEGQRWLEHALERSGEAPAATQARTLIAAGRLAWLRGELALATERLEQALALRPEPFDRCEALNGLGDVARYQGAYERAEAVLAEAIELGRAQEDWFHLAASLHNLGTVALDHGDHEGARAALEEGLAWARQTNHRYLSYSLLHYLSVVAFAQGDYPRVATLRREDLAIQLELMPTAPLGAVGCFEGIGLLAVVQDQPAPAARLFGAAAMLRERAEDIERAETKLIGPWVAIARDALGAAEFARAWEGGRASPLETMVAEAASLLEAWTWTACGEPVVSRRAGDRV